MAYPGFGGKILSINLSDRSITTKELERTLIEKYLGGGGIGERLLVDILKPGVDPLGPFNPLIFSVGPMVGTQAVGSSKVVLNTKSPMPSSTPVRKYHISRATSGSRKFGTQMKKAGFDHVIIMGCSENPCYLHISNGTVEIRSATDLWGKSDALETTEALRDRHPGSGVYAIGPAGEQKVPFSLGWVDTNFHLGKNGGAAVMGSKNLKAIVVEGDQAIKVHSPQRLKDLTQAAIEEMRQAPFFPMRHATPRFLSSEQTPKYSPEIFEKTLNGWRGCDGCVYKCKGAHQIMDGPHKGAAINSGFTLGLMYERRHKLLDYREFMKLVESCNRAGICFITFQAMGNFIIKLFERGKISLKDSDGQELLTGNLDSYLWLLDRIIAGEGIGALMAEGWHAIKDAFGVDPDIDPDGDSLVKNCTITIDPRFSSFHSVHFSQLVNPRASMELHPNTFVPNLPAEVIKKWCRGIAMSEVEIEGIFEDDQLNTGKYTKHVEDGEGVYYALGNCIIWVVSQQVYTLPRLAEFYSAITGIDLTPRELKTAGERVWNVFKCLNAREGFNRQDDALPGQWRKTIEKPHLTVNGESYLTDYYGNRITEDDYEKTLDDYYGEHGWDLENGIPTQGRLKELGIDKLFAD